MTNVEELTRRYGEQLRGFGASLPDDFAQGAAAASEHLDDAQLETWASEGVSRANHSLRSWEAAAEYFRASPAMLPRLGADRVQEWLGMATELASRSSLMAAAFIKATPDVLEHVEPEALEEWSRQGDMLCRGNWKSIA